MADTAFSGFLSASTLADADQLVGLQAGGNIRATLLQIAQYIEARGGWVPLGASVLGAAAARTSDVIWTANYSLVDIAYFIQGYAGGAIGRVVPGSGSISEAATNCCTELIEATTRTTTSVSVCGFPTAVTVAAAQRSGTFRLDNNISGQVKRFTGRGQHSGTAPTTVPTAMTMNGLCSLTGVIDRVRLTSFSAITGNTVGSNLNAGSFIIVMGKP